jgi:hypothetical protein
MDWQASISPKIRVVGFWGRLRGGVLIQVMKRAGDVKSTLTSLPHFPRKMGEVNSIRSLTDKK